MAAPSKNEVLRRERLLRRVTAQNQDDIVGALLKGRENVENSMIKAARNQRFGTSKAIRDGVYVNLRDQYMQLQGDMDTWTDKSIENTGKEFHHLVVEDLATDGIKAQSFTQFKDNHFREYFERVHPMNADRLAFTNVNMNKQLSGMLDSDIAQMQQKTVEVFRRAQVEGLTSSERFKLLRGSLLDVADNPKSWQFIASDGKKWANNNYFSMLNRTISANVARDSYNDELTDQGLDLVQIIGGISSNSAKACIAYAGRIVSLTGATSGYPTLADYEGAGGFHPNCVHFTAYVSEFTKKGLSLLEEQKGEPKPVVEQPKSKRKVAA